MLLLALEFHFSLTSDFIFSEYLLLFDAFAQTFMLANMIFGLFFGKWIQMWLGVNKLIHGGSGALTNPMLWAKLFLSVLNILNFLFFHFFQNVLCGKNSLIRSNLLPLISWWTCKYLWRPCYVSNRWGIHNLVWQ